MYTGPEIVNVEPRNRLQWTNSASLRDKVRKWTVQQTGICGDSDAGRHRCVQHTGRRCTTTQGSGLFATVGILFSQAQLKKLKNPMFDRYQNVVDIIVINIPNCEKRIRLLSCHLYSLIQGRINFPIFKHLPIFCDSSFCPYGAFITVCKYWNAIRIQTRSSRSTTKLQEKMCFTSWPSKILSYNK